MSARLVLDGETPYATNIPITSGRGKTWYVDTNGPGVANNSEPLGTSWQSAFTTMGAAFALLSSGDTVEFVGNVNEQLTTPYGVTNVTIRGVGRPRHADTHPYHGEIAASTWKIGALGNNPLLIMRYPGWRLENFLVAAHASNYAFRLERTAEDGLTPSLEQDASHAEFKGIRFASGGGGISDTGGCFDVAVEDCIFQAITVACILGVGNIGVGQLMWHIMRNHFNNFTNGVKIAGFECLIADNFFTDGGTPNTTFVLNTNNGGGRDNFIARNFFQTATANFNTPDIVGTATDVWTANCTPDAQAAGVSGIYEIGQPA